MSRLAIVTGGTRGIGRAISARLKADGYQVAALYAGNDEAARQCADETGVATYKCDVSDFDACKSAVEAIEADHGGTYVLVNNAGITRDAPFHKMSPEQWKAVVDTNLDSVFNMTRQVIDGMRGRGAGRIVGISSINGQKGQFGQTNYSAAKAGLIGFTRALALETARKGITVNAVAPGYIDTDMLAGLRQDVLDKIVGDIPVGRLGKPEEIAHAVSYLASEQAGFVTGAVISANGGQYIAA